ncbi:hypothetical protein C6372_06020 [Bacillus halotolerans]|nr:hypothetical protein C6372_06020 [Bacillus halotolerans]
MPQITLHLILFSYSEKMFYLNDFFFVSIKEVKKLNAILFYVLSRLQLKLKKDRQMHEHLTDLQ